jgi:hypothetical protein
LTETREKFFKTLNDLISDESKPDFAQWSELLKEKKVNIDIQYLKRDQLPICDIDGKKIRPAFKQPAHAAIPVIDQFQLDQPRVGQRRTFTEMM